ncbi:hypothetical protein FNF27_00760 [Cafeteria roenbergensis]|uniref:Abnormal spindle-like microcephaly-associated protein ASH domain-containing protein n=2 Tax=Cafeteria roenbergensis TaxID=33653 RepID=A0A5A8ENS3_CAFRO|nr:hypothetical protein FNF27_00760 [Cafeteria roenbergensis]
MAALAASASSLSLPPHALTGAVATSRSVARESRMREFGIDCGDGLSWGGGTWEPGGEYVQRLHVKNVSARMQRVRWRLPESKFFSMEFPDPVRLAPGSSVVLEVRFRPVRREEYEDSITFTVDAGSFAVPVRARLSRLETAVTSAIEFGLVPVNEPTGVAFLLENSGQVPARFQWQCPAPFDVEPSSGLVAPGESARLVCTLLCSAASILDAVAAVTVEGVGDDVAGSGWERHTVALSATSKFQHIHVTPSRVDLGDVMVGSGPHVRLITLSNPGPVRATVTVRPAESDRAPHFTLGPQRVLVEAGATTQLRLVYQPRVHGSFSCERFQLTTPGGSGASVEAKACARGPRVTIARKDSASAAAAATAAAAAATAPGRGTLTARGGPPPSSSLAFGDVPVGSSRSHVCRLRNASDAPAHFCVMAEAGGIFAFGQTQGVVPARLFTDVVVVFSPRCPGNFYRRVYVLVRDSDPLFIDLLGSGMDERTRPFPIRQRHVDAFRLRPPALRLMAPDSVKEVARLHREAEEAGADPEAELPRRHGVPALTSPLTRATEAELSPALTDPSTRASLTPGEDRTRAAAALLEEMLQPPDAPGRPFVLSRTVIQMGSVLAGALPPKQVVSLTNRSAGKVTVQWLVPRSSLAPERGQGEPASADDDVRDFAVSPPVCDIDAGATADFSVAFRPHQASAWFAQELEAVVFPKQNRTFRLVDDVSFTPPETLLLRVMGNSFAGGTSFLPRFSTSLAGGGAKGGGGGEGAGLGGPLHLDMPACPVGSATFAVFELRNEGQVPAAFEVTPPDPTAQLTVAPTLGLIPVGAFALLIVRFRPRRAGDHAHAFQLLLNGDSVASPMLKVRGVCAAPRLALPDGGAVFAPPTAVGATSSVVVPVANGSRVPASFRVRVPASAAASVSVAPSCGVVRGNEIQPVRVTFCPSSQGHAAFRLACDVMGGGALSFAALGGAADRLNSYLPMRSFEARDLMTATSGAAAGGAAALAAAAAAGAAAGGGAGRAPQARSGAGAGARAGARKTGGGTGWLLDDEEEEELEGGYGGSPARAGGRPLSRGQGHRGAAGTAIETKDDDGDAAGAAAAAAASAKAYPVSGEPSSATEEDAEWGGVVVPLQPDPPADPAAVWPWGSADPLATLGATLVSQGTEGALGFAPAGADMGPGLVGEGTHRAIALENRSGCALRWRLKAAVDVEPATGAGLSKEQRLRGGPGGCDVDCDGDADEAMRRRLERASALRDGAALGSRGSRSLNSARSGFTSATAGAAGARPMPTYDADRSFGDDAADGGGGFGDGDEDEDYGAAGGRAGERGDADIFASGEVGQFAEVTFEPREGTLPARSRTQVDVSIIPRVVGRVAVRVAYELESVDAAGVVTRHGADAVRAVEAAQADAAAVRAAAVEQAGETGVVVVPTAPALNTDSVWCDLRTSAEYPVVAVEDARAVQSREALLWLFPAHEESAGPGPEELFRGGGAATMLSGALTRAGPGTASVAPSGVRGEASGALSVARSGAGAGGGGGGGGGGGRLGQAGGDMLDALLAHTAAAPSGAPEWTTGEGDPSVLSDPGTARALASPAASVSQQRLSVAGAAGSSAVARHGDNGSSSGAALALGMPEPEPRIAGDPAGGWQFRLPAPLALPWQGPLSAAAAAAFRGWQPGQASPPVPCSGSPSALWEQCSLRDLNRMLARKLSPQEVAHAKAGPLHRDPAELPTATVEFTPAPLGAPPEVFFWQLRNVSGLPADIELAFPSDSEIDTEQWTEPAEPSRSEVRTRQLLDRRVFDVQPRKLTVPAGGRALLQLHYAHVTTALADGPNGSHQVEVLLRVARGRTVRLRLRGQTLRPHVPLLWLGRPAPSRRLQPVPLGVDLPPVQTVTLRNPTSAPVRFRVDPHPFEEATQEAHGFAVWECLTPEGELAPGAEGQVRLRFTPLEATDYALRLRVQFGPALADAPIARAFEAVRGEAAATAAEATEAAEEYGVAEPGASARLEALLSKGRQSAGAGAGAAPLMDELLDDAAEALRCADEAAEAFAAACPSLEASAQQRLAQLRREHARRRRAIGVDPSAKITPTMLRALQRDVTVVVRARGYTPWSARDASTEGADRVVDCSPPLVRPGLIPVGAAGAAAETAAVAAAGASARSAMRSDGMEGPAEEMAGEAGDETGSADHVRRKPIAASPSGGGDGDRGGAAAGAGAESLAGHPWSRSELSLPRPGDREGADADWGHASAVSDAATVAAQGAVVTSSATPASHMTRIRGLLGSLRLQDGTAAVRAAEEAAAKRKADAAKVAVRAPRPGCAPPDFHCAFPPLRRHLAMPVPWLAEGMARVVPERAAFGDVPVGTRAHRIVVLVSERSVPTPDAPATGRFTARAVAPSGGAAGVTAMAISRPAGFGGGGGSLVFEWDLQHPLLAKGGPVTVHPRRGRLEPGEAAVCRLTLTSGAHPAVLEADLPIVVAVPEEEMVARSGKARRRAAALGLKEQQAAQRKPPEPGHVPVALKSTSARNARITAAAVEKHTKALVRERSSVGDVGLEAKSAATQRLKQRREALAGAAAADEEEADEEAARLGAGRRGGGVPPAAHPAAIALGAGRKGRRPEDALRAAAAGPGVDAGAVVRRADSGLRGPEPATAPSDPAEARVAGVVAAVRDALVAAQAPAGSADEGGQGPDGKSVARSVASSRSRLSAGRSSAAVDAAAAAVPTPVPPATVLFVRLSARVCGEAEFRQAHGSARFAAFLRGQTLGAAHGGLPALRGEDQRKGLPDAGAQLASVDGPVEADAGAAVAPVRGAAAGSAARHMLEDVLDSLVADLVAGADMAEAQAQAARASSTQKSMPTFRELAARRGREVAGAAAAPAEQSSAPAARGAALRAQTLRDEEARVLCARYLQTTVVNLARDIAAGAIDLASGSPSAAARGLDE